MDLSIGLPSGGKSCGCYQSDSGQPGTRRLHCFSGSHPFRLLPSAHSRWRTTAIPEAI